MEQFPRENKYKKGSNEVDCPLEIMAKRYRNLVNSWACELSKNLWQSTQSTNENGLQ